MMTMKPQTHSRNFLVALLVPLGALSGCSNDEGGASTEAAGAAGGKASVSQSGASGTPSSGRGGMTSASGGTSAAIGGDAALGGATSGGTPTSLAGSAGQSNGGSVGSGGADASGAGGGAGANRGGTSSSSAGATNIGGTSGTASGGIAGSSSVGGRGGVGGASGGTAGTTAQGGQAGQRTDGAAGGSIVTPESCRLAFQEDVACAGQSNPAARTFYVSSSMGSDSNDGLTQATPLKTIGAVNALALVPGDRVLFHCGDLWRGESLVITKSGAACQHIVFGSYPSGCADQPILSGSKPISGWVQQSGTSLWTADLGAGANAGAFPKGINQLFQAGQRLPLGKWPNADNTAFDHGYSFIERQPLATAIEDDQLPATDWSGAVIRVKTIRWLLLNRKVASSSGMRLTLEQPLSCWNGTCGASSTGHGWGYLITNHPATLDQAGEWYHDAATNRVTLYSASAPSSIEGSYVPGDVADIDEPGMRGIVVLGQHLGAHIRYVAVENLSIQNGFRHGITTPTNLELDENSELVIRCNTIRNMDSIGLCLATWVWNAGDASGWRGGYNQLIAGNVIDGANQFGIHSYASHSTFQDNQVRNIGLVENLGRMGLGCAFTGDNCTEEGGGIHMPIDQAARTSYSNVLRHNTIERIAACGVGLYGAQHLLEENALRELCVTKGDCGAVCTFGQTSLADTPVHDITLNRNVVDTVPGNVDGANAEFAVPFGFGFYIDNYSRNIVADGNTIVNTSHHAILYQASSGVVRNNLAVVSNDGVPLTFSNGGSISQLSGNTLVALLPNTALVVGDAARLSGSDNNVFFNPYYAQCVDNGNGTAYTLPEWRSVSNQDTNSIAAWYSLAATAPSNVEVFVNDTGIAKTIALTKSYVDLRQTAVSGSLVLQPYSGRVLVAQ